MKIRAVLVLALCLGLAAGCCIGYRAGFLIPADIHSVHVRMPENETFWREAIRRDNVEVDTDSVVLAQSDTDSVVLLQPSQTIEVDLAERLKNEIVRQTPLRLADEDRADSILKTTITRLEPSVLIRNPEDEVLSERVTVQVDFQWVERRSGRVIAAGSGIARPTDYNAARGENFTMATRKSFDFIARQIIELMREDF
jgi:hypothetical protein